MAVAGLGEGCSHMCIVVLPTSIRHAHGRLDWARDAATWPIGLGEGCSHIGCTVVLPRPRCVMHMADWIGRGMQPHRPLDWARDAGTSVHVRPPQDASCTWPTGLGEGCSHIGALLYCIAHLKIRCTWPIGLGEGCSHIADWIGRGMQPHRCTVVLHRPPQDTSCTWPIGLGEGCSHNSALLYCPPQDASCTWPTGLGEGCSHIGALLYCIAHLKMRHVHGRLDWARDAATSVHCCTASPTSRCVMYMADWIGRGMHPHRPIQSAMCMTYLEVGDAATWPIGLGEGCSHIGALLYCIAHLKIRYVHGRLDWARDAATSVQCCIPRPIQSAMWLHPSPNPIGHVHDAS